MQSLFVVTMLELGDDRFRQQIIIPYALPHSSRAVLSAAELFQFKDIILGEFNAGLWPKALSQKIATPGRILATGHVPQLSGARRTRSLRVSSLLQRGAREPSHQNPAKLPVPYANYPTHTLDDNRAD